MERNNPAHPNAPFSTPDLHLVEDLLNVSDLETAVQPTSSDSMPTSSSFLSQGNLHAQAQIRNTASQTNTPSTALNQRQVNTANLVTNCLTVCNSVILGDFSLHTLQELKTSIDTLMCQIHTLLGYSKKMQMFSVLTSLFDNSHHNLTSILADVQTTPNLVLSENIKLCIKQQLLKITQILLSE